VNHHLLKLDCEKKPQVTIGLSVFNGGALLEKSVRSILNQTMSDWELLIIDDGSTDNSIESLSCINDPRIHLLRDGLNLGLAARLNQAINLARGTYFARMDHDDIAHPERLARQVAHLDHHPEIDLLSSACITINEDEELLGFLPHVTEHQMICQKPWQGFYMPHPTWMGKLSWFRHYRYRDPAPYCCEDQELLLRAYRNSTYHSLSECLLAYRIRKNVPLKKLWRTRLAMLKVQVEYFYYHHQWFNGVLSAAVAVIRITHDVIRCWSFYKLTLGSRSFFKKKISTEWATWEALLKTFRRDSGS